MKPRKILIVYSSRPPIVTDLSEAFLKQGIETDFVLSDKTTWFDKWIIRVINKQLHNLRILPKNRNAFSAHPLAHQNFRSNQLAQKIKEFEPDIVFMVRGINYNHDVLAKAKCLFGWWIEREERTAEAIREASFFDWYFFLARASVEQAKTAGFENSSYQSHVVNPSRFYKLENCRKQYDVCFVGNWSPYRQRYIEAILEVTPNVAIYGRKWRRNNIFNPKLLRAVKGAWVEGDKLNLLYNESRIVFNITNWGAGSGKGRSGMNMRVFEVPASGAFLLTDESREMEEFLTPGVHVGVFDEKDLVGMKKILGFYLSNNNSREKIALDGYLHVRDKYTYDVVAHKVVSIYESMEISKFCDA
jgi:spore maturation protein CgeB